MQETTLAQAKSKKKHRKLQDLEKHGGASKNEKKQKNMFFNAYSGSRKDGAGGIMMAMAFSWPRKRKNMLAQASLKQNKKL